MTSNSPETKHQPTLAEWISFSISLSILTALISLVIFAWTQQKNTPPIVTLQTTETIREVEGQFYVPFTVTNTGGETAASIQIIAELKDGTYQETGEQEIEFLSGGELEEGAFIFSRDPRQGQLKLRVASYQLP